MEDRANILRQMKVCRFCLSDKEQDLLNIHEKHPQNSDITIPLPSLSLQIMACIAVEVIQNDGMPQYICKNCRQLTTQAYIFKTNCRKADDALKLFLVTGQLSKPYLQNVVHIKVQPTSEKIIKLVLHDDEKNQPEVQPTEENTMEVEEVEQVYDERSEEVLVEEQNQSKPQQVQTLCFPCNQCERSFPLKQLLDLHVLKHNRERKFECDVCNYKFFNKYDLQKHMLTHTAEKEYACIVCNKTFSRESFLRRHEKIHEDVPKYCCTHCDKTFLTKDYLDYHMKKHEKQRPFTCKICQKSFVFKQGLERHEVVHSENKPHKCNYCEASFISAIKLTRHITLHAGLRPYPCKLCGRTFLLSHHLTRHMRSHYSSSTYADGQIGQHKCDICSMSFRRKDSLINHSAIHSMVNLKCVICNTMFESAALVKEHITTHLSSLPYPCERCDYSFETEEQVEEHELKHAEMEYEEQIEKEVFSESLIQPDRGDEEAEEEEDAELRQFSIVDIDNQETDLRSSEQSNIEAVESDDNAPRLQFLKDEVVSDEEVEENEEDEEEEEEEEEQSVNTELIKPIIRQEGTKVYQRKNVSSKTTPDIRLSSLKASPEKQQQTPLPNNISTDLNTVSKKTLKLGEKLVKVQKFILTKDEMKAMAKQGILEIKGGKVVLKSGGQQIINASLKPIQKNEIDSLLDKRSANRMNIKKYEKKSSSAGPGGEENATT